MKAVDIAIKDLRRAARSLMAVGMMVVVPLLITGLIYFAFGGLLGGGADVQLPPLKVLVVNLDEPPAEAPALGQSVVDFLNDERLPDWLEAAPAGSEAEARAAIDSQQAGAAVIVPADYTAQLMAPDGRAALVLLHDPTLSLGPAVLEMLLGQYTDGVVGARVALAVVGERAAEANRPLDASTLQQLIVRYGEWFTALQQNINHSATPVLRVQAPGADEAGAGTTAMGDILARTMAAMLTFFAFYAGAVTAESIVREDEEGTLARLFTTPTPRGQILAGKYLAVFLTLAVQALVLIAISSLAFRIRWGAAASVALVAGGLIAAAAGVGVLIMSLVKSTRQSGPVLGGVLTVMGMLGGLFTTGVTMPPAFETVNLLTPHGWAMRGWRLALDGAGPADVLVPVAVTALIGLVCLAAGTRLFSRRFG